MAGFTSGEVSQHLERSKLWSAQLKDILLANLQASGYVNWLSEFPDGDTFIIPSIGQANARDYQENTPVTYDAMDTGEFQFQITEYISSGTYITRKAMQDMFYMSQLVSSFVPKQNRAIMENVETNILSLQGQQVASDSNTINGAAHRLVASGTNNVISVQDFAKALYALKKANVPATDLIAIVDPSVEYTLNTLTNLVNVSNNAKWEGIITSGIGGTDMRFVKNIYGFDVYTSNFLPQGIDETIGGTTISGAVPNMFFSATSDVLPFIGAWRQQPIVDSKFNMDLQREEYVTTARYGVKLYRPENLVVTLSNPTVS